MVGTTLFLAVLLSIFAISRRNRGEALGILVLSMLIWPEYLRIPTGIAELSIPRVVAAALLFKYIIQPSSLRPKSLADKLVVLLWVWTVFANIFAGSDSSQLNQMIGRSLDTVLVYFVAKLSIRAEDDLKGMYLYLALTAIVVGGLGVVETITSYSPYTPLLSYRTWSWIDKPDEYRLGFLRAKGSTSVHIFFGMAMSIIFGLLLALKEQVGSGIKRFAPLIVSALGVMSSMSSGPWLTLIIIIIIWLISKRPTIIKPIIICVILTMVGIELLSNRHFYNLIDYLALDKNTAWYRTRIIEVAFERSNEFIVFGMGSNWPHHWGALVDGRNHIDIVNNYLIIALYGGVFALFLYLWIQYSIIKSGVLFWRNQDKPELRLFVFVALGTLVAIDVSSMSVGLFGPALMLTYLLLGVISGVSSFYRVHERNSITTK